MHENRILIHRLKNFENINSNFLIIILMLFGSILLAISAKVQVPFWPVPMTMQTFVIFLIGMTYSGMLFASIVISYLANLGFSKTYFKATVSLLIGSAIIFSFGIIYLGYIIGFEKAVAAGLLPFIPSELFKIALAVALIPTLHKIITK